MVVNLDGLPSWVEKHPEWRLLKHTSGCVGKDVCRDRKQLRGSRKMTLNVGDTFYWAAIQRLKWGETSTGSFSLSLPPRIPVPCLTALKVWLCHAAYSDGTNWP